MLRKELKNQKDLKFWFSHLVAEWLNLLDFLSFSERVPISHDCYKNKIIHIMQMYGTWLKVSIQ